MQRKEVIFLRGEIERNCLGKIELLVQIRDKEGHLKPKECAGASLNTFMQFRINDYL